MNLQLLGALSRIVGHDTGRYSMECVHVIPHDSGRLVYASNGMVMAGVIEAQPVTKPVRIVGFRDGEQIGDDQYDYYADEPYDKQYIEVRGISATLDVSADGVPSFVPEFVSATDTREMPPEAIILKPLEDRGAMTTVEVNPLLLLDLLRIVIAFGRDTSEYQACRISVSQDPTQPAYIEASDKAGNRSLCCVIMPIFDKSKHKESK